jgi:RNA-directed DNA polymerase
MTDKPNTPPSPNKFPTPGTLSPEMAAKLDAWRYNFTKTEWRDEVINWWERTQQHKAQKTRERQLRDRRFFGPEISATSKTHYSAQYRPDQLKALGLPLLQYEGDLASWLGIDMGHLRWFTHDVPSDTVWHYNRYTIAKRSGGQRVILAPKAELKAIQHKILHNILDKISTSDHAHGFIAGRSIHSNAQPHVGKGIVLNLDLKDFFPSITYPRVRGLFIRWGYGFSVASTLAMLCTEHDRVKFIRSVETYWVSVTPRALVQGAPTSPALANAAAWQLDKRLAGLAAKHQFTYTRYADDLTFSGGQMGQALRLYGIAQHIIKEEGFAVNEKKTHFYSPATRQIVTGLVVNSKVSTPRSTRRKVRAILHNAQKTGLAAQNREGHENFRAYLTGLIAFISQANPEEGAKLLTALGKVQ